MPKFKNVVSGETKELGAFVVKMAPAIIVGGKRIPNGGWVPVADVNGDAEKVLDGTKPPTKTEKAEATKTAKTKASEATDLIETIASAETREDYDATLEAAKTALAEASEASAISNTKAASIAVDKATKALDAVEDFVDAEGDDTDLLGEVKQ